MGRKKSERTAEEWRVYHNDRQRAYYAKNIEKKRKRQMELYYEKKERRASDEEV